MNTLDKNTIKHSKFGHLDLNARITLAATMVANGEVVSFRGASAETYNKVQALANKIKQDREFPQCPCGECD
jgi:ribosomal 50S subunit-recycling heat shock protein